MRFLRRDKVGSHRRSKKKIASRRLEKAAGAHVAEESSDRPAAGDVVPSTTFSARKSGGCLFVSKDGSPPLPARAADSPAPLLERDSVPLPGPLLQSATLSQHSQGKHAQGNAGDLVQSREVDETESSVSSGDGVTWSSSRADPDPETTRRTACPFGQSSSPPPSPAGTCPGNDKGHQAGRCKSPVGYRQARSTDCCACHCHEGQPGESTIEPEQLAGSARRPVRLSTKRMTRDRDKAEPLKAVDEVERVPATAGSNDAQEPQDTNGSGLVAGTRAAMVTSGTKKAKGPPRTTSVVVQQTNRPPKQDRAGTLNARPDDDGSSKKVEEAAKAHPNRGPDRVEAPVRSSGAFEPLPDVLTLTRPLNGGKDHSKSASIGHLPQSSASLTGDTKARTFHEADLTRPFLQKPQLWGDAIPFQPPGRPSETLPSPPINHAAGGRSYEQPGRLPGTHDQLTYGDESGDPGRGGEHESPSLSDLQPSDLSLLLADDVTEIFEEDAEGIPLPHGNLPSNSHVEESLGGYPTIVGARQDRPVNTDGARTFSSWPDAMPLNNQQNPEHFLPGFWRPHQLY